jgi:hypothetical protein
MTIVSILVVGFMAWFGEPENQIIPPFILFMVMVVVQFLMSSLVAVGTFRFVIANEFPRGPFWIFLGKREIRFFFEVISMSVIFQLPAIGLMLASIFLSSDGAQTVLHFVMIVSPVFSIVMVWVSLRLAPFFPASALGQQGSLIARLKMAWLISKGTALRLLGTMAVVGIPFIFVMLFSMLVSTVLDQLMPIIGGVNVAYMFVQLINASLGFFYVILVSMTVALYYQRIVNSPEKFINT